MLIHKKLSHSWEHMWLYIKVLESERRWERYQMLDK